jgi:hypothetical protein
MTGSKLLNEGICPFRAAWSAKTPGERQSVESSVDWILSDLLPVAPNQRFASVRGHKSTPVKTRFTGFVQLDFLPLQSLAGNLPSRLSALCCRTGAGKEYYAVS